MSEPPLPLVTVVTPSLNQAKYLDLTIKSVLDQDYPRIEHIVVDGGSTDGTLELLENYPHLIWVSEPDGGQADAVNKGFQQASGEILGWLNSDDLYLPGAVSKAAAHLRRAPADLVYGDYVEIDELGEELEAMRVPGFDLDFSLNVRNVIPQPATFIRRSVLDSVGMLDTSYRYAMDYEFWIRIARAGCRIDHVPEFWACFRRHSTSKSVAEADRFWQEARRVARSNGGRLLSKSLYLHTRQRLHERVLQSPLRPIAVSLRWLIRDKLGISG